MDRIDTFLLVPIRLVVWIPLIAGQSWLCPNSDNRMLRIPDWNSMFNTLGNFAVNSCWTGFLDFARSRTYN